jgi:6-phosphogluconolactonase (cycloisomerase 2 family)
MKKIFSAFLSLAVAISLNAQEEYRLLVGTYTENTPADGVYLYSFDAQTAEVRLLDMAPSGNPSFVIANPDQTRAYSVNEYNDGRQGVSSFELEADSIRGLNSVIIPKEQTDGEDPCNLLFDGETIISSNYTGGTVTAFALNEDGSILGTSQYFSYSSEYFQALTGLSLGSDPAHMHCAVLSPDGKYFFVTNLGMDCIHRFERVEGIHPLGNSTVAWKHTGLTKFGPRHMVFSADGKYAYLLCELGDKLVVFEYEDGKLNPIQTLTAYKGKGHGSADLHISPDGRYLYTSHRLKEDGIAIFGIDKATGKVKKAGYQPTGRHPRNFAITPDGNWLLCACRDDNRIEVYSINKETGALSATGKTIDVGAPVCVQILSRED